jgi:hypothetical protein
MKGRGNLEGLDINGRIILKGILEKWDGRWVVGWIHLNQERDQ